MIGSMIAPGSAFGPYRIIEKIGAGGMGDVYRALDTRLEREVALKLISDSFLATEAGTGSPSPAGTPNAMSGDKPNAKKAYDTFFQEWKDADADLPVIAEARKEYAQLS